MENLIIYLGISIFVLIFVYFILVIRIRNLETMLLNGFWKGDDDFCSQSETDLFLVKLNTQGIFSSTLNGYILVKNQEGIIMNNPFDLSLSGGYTFDTGMTEKTYNVTFDWLGEESYDFFPSKQKMYYSAETGKIIFYDDNQIYAILYKDNELSNATRSNSLPKDIPLNPEEEFQDIQVDQNIDSTDTSQELL